MQEVAATPITALPRAEDIAAARRVTRLAIAVLTLFVLTAFASVWAATLSLVVKL